MSEKEGEASCGVWTRARVILINYAAASFLFSIYLIFDSLAFVYFGAAEGNPPLSLRILSTVPPPATKRGN